MTADAEKIGVAEHYVSLLDRQILTYIDTVNASYPTDAVDTSPEQQRQHYQTLCEQFAVTPPASVSTEDLMIDVGQDVLQRLPVVDDESPQLADAYRSHRLPLRHYVPDVTTDDTAVVVYLHGGGFVVGNLESHHDLCGEICERTGYEVLSVDYRLSPENLHPAALFDAIAAVSYATARYDKVVLCGDSAGANLCAAVSAACNDLAQRVSGQVLIYPGLGANITRGSYIIHNNAPMLTTEDVVFYSRIRVPRHLHSMIDKLLYADASTMQQTLNELSESHRHWAVTLAPLLAQDFTKVPFTVAFGAQCDPLHDDSVNYCALINHAGGRATCISEPGLIHGYLRARHHTSKARASFDRIVNAVSHCAKRTPDSA